MTNTDLAYHIAQAAHAGQTDKQGQPYILHVLRVAKAAQEVFLRATSEDLKDIVPIALMHDVIEDSTIAVYNLTELGFNRNIIDAVSVITKREDETYKKYINRVLNNRLARQVKILDIEDHLRPGNMLFFESRSNMFRRYTNALRVLKSNIPFSIEDT